MDVSDEEYQKVLSEFLFLNTGDLLLLNAISNLEKTRVYEDEQYMVIDAIKICKNAVTKSKLQSSNEECNGICPNTKGC